MTRSYDQIYALQKQELWLEAITALEQQLSEEKHDAEARIQLIFLLWYILLELDPKKFGLTEEAIEKSLRDHFAAAQELLFDVPEYLFFVGDMIHLTDWYFKGDDFPDAMAQAEKMVSKAFLTEPNNLLYEWGYSMIVARDAEKSKRIAKKLSDAIDIGEYNQLSKRGLLGEYFREMIKSSCNL